MNGEVRYADASVIRVKAEPNGYVIVLDPGHQLIGNSSKEPIGPNSMTMKTKVSHGTSGKHSGLKEYELVLMIGLKLQKELEYRGYTVIMTRTTHEVNISNSERATIANEANADAFIRIHANGSTKSSVNGAHTICQSAKNRYNGELHEQSKALSTCILNDMCNEIEIKKNSVYTDDSMTGINWSKVPVTLLEMGFMTNEFDDLYMADEYNQYKIITGIANGIDRFIAGDTQ